MAFKLAELFVEITGRKNHFDGVMGAAHKQLSSFGVMMGNLGSSAVSGAFSLVGTAVKGTVGLIGQAVTQASDLGETVNKVNVVFGASADAVKAMAQEMDRSFGVVQTESLEAASNLGLLLKGAGMTSRAAAEMSNQLVRLAADASSFYNVGIDDALERIRAGLSGEAEPLKKFGVLLDEDTMKLKAAQMAAQEAAAGHKLYGEHLNLASKDLDIATKTAVRYQMILEKLTAAQGDLARTSGGFANQSRQMWGRLSNLITEFGKGLQPAFETTLRSVNFLLTDLGQAIQAQLPSIQSFADRLAGGAKYAALAWREFPTVWELIKLKGLEAFEQFGAVAKNTLVGLARFTADLFSQIFDNITIGIGNALADAVRNNIELIQTLSLGAIDPMENRHWMMRTAPKPITPDTGLLGNPLANLPNRNDQLAPLYAQLDAAMARLGIGGAAAAPGAGAGAAGDEAPFALPEKAKKPKKTDVSYGAEEWGRKIQEAAFAGMKDDVPKQQLAEQRKIATLAEQNAVATKLQIDLLTRIAARLVGDLAAKAI